ncbi:hypothetical protein IAE22_30785 [Bacillus sp. S34]|nr:hypothetical protein [Bacillus sp. S34]
MPVRFPLRYRLAVAVVVVVVALLRGRRRVVDEPAGSEHRAPRARLRPGRHSSEPGL